MGLKKSEKLFFLLAIVQKTCICYTKAIKYGEDMKVLLKSRKRRIIITGIIVSILVIILGVFIIPFFNGKSLFNAYIYKIKYYDSLSPERQANYDKMKISYAKITKRVTGTEPFNTETKKSVDDGSVVSNSEGIDVSANDNYIRTFDTITYNLEVGIERNEATTTDLERISGGVIKVKVTLPTYAEGRPLMIWDSKDVWMKNASISTDQTVLTAEYHFDENESPIGGNQELSFSILVEGYKKEITDEMKPKFEVWMEGNKPDNLSSSVESKIIKDEEPLIISAKKDYALNIYEGQINQRATRDGVIGNYISYYASITLNKKGSGYKSLFGLEIPTEKITTNLNIEYYYRDINSDDDWIKIEDDTPRATNRINGTTVISGDYLCGPSANFWPRAYYNQRPSGYCGKQTVGGGSFDNSRSKDDSGIMTFSQNIEKLKLFNEDYYVINYDSTYSALCRDGFEIFVPHYDNAGKDYDYKIVINGESIQTKNNDGTDFIEDTNASVSTILNNRITGNISYSLNGPVTVYDAGNQYIGTTERYNSYISSNEGPYLGGAERLWVWDSEKLEIIPNNTANGVSISYSNNGVLDTPTKDNITVEYGIYKSNGGEAISDTNIINQAKITDFDWYSSKNEAIEHGIVSALHIIEPDLQGNKVGSYVYANFKAIENINNINKLGIMKHKVYFYADEAKTQKYEAGENINYIPGVIRDYYQNVQGSPINIGQSFGIRIYEPTTLLLTKKHTNDESTRNFNVSEKYINLELIPSLKKYSENIPANSIVDLHFSVDIPSGFKYRENSASIEPTEISGNTIYWTIKDYDINKPLPHITFEYEMSPYIANNASFSIYHYFGYTYNGIKLGDSDYAYIDVSNLAGSSMRINMNKDVVDKNESFELTEYLYNISDEILENTKTISILPKNNDANGSSIQGNYTIKVLELSADQKMFYTTNPITNIGLVEDSEGNKVIKAVNLETDNRWIEVSVGETIPSNATAIATLVPTINKMEDIHYKYQVIPSNNNFGNKYIFKTIATSDNLSNAIKSDILRASVVSRSITGKVFIDKDRNNEYNDKDILLSNHTIKLLDSNKNVLETTTTDALGIYKFNNLEKGSYYVRFDSKENYIFIPKGTSSKANSNGETDLISSLNTNPTKVEEIIDNIDAGIATKEAKLNVKYVDEAGRSMNEADNIINKTVFYFDEYSTEAKTYQNYELKEIVGDSVSGTVNKDIINITYVYKLKTSTIKVKYVDEDGNDIDITKNITTTKNWGENYEYNKLDFPYYDYVNSNGTTSGIVQQDTIEISFIYKRKTGVINIKYVDENGNDIDPSKNIINQPTRYGDNYSSEKLSFKNYNFVKTEGDNTSGIVEKASIDINYIYTLKESVLVVRYVDENGNDIDPSKNINESKHWGDNYETTKLNFTNYDYQGVEGDTSGIISSNNVTVIYKYKLKTATVTIRYTDESMKDILTPIVTPSNWGKNYTSTQKSIPNYNFVKQEGDAPNGVITKDNINIIYIYKLKVGKVVTHHYLYDGQTTTEQLAPDVSKDYNYTEEYDTEVSKKVAKNYEFKSRTSNFRGIVDKDLIDVYYYYQLKDSSLMATIEKDGTKLITNKDEEVSYSIDYTANVTDYIGDGTITLKEILPYSIDIEKSDLDGGTYDKETNTIVWTIPWNNINTYNENDLTATKNVKKNIKVVYIGISGRDRTMVSKTTSKVELSNNTREVDADAPTDIRIKGKIVVEYVDSETGESISPQQEESSLVGESVTVQPIVKEGWELIEVPAEEEYEYEEEEQNVKYIYRRMRFNIETKTLNNGGEISGDEIVYYGDSSTEEKIKIIAKKDYVIERVLVDGEEIEIKNNLRELIIDKFDEVKENHLVEVSFKYSPDISNPKTNYNILIIAIMFIIVTSFIIYNKKKDIIK